MEQKTTKAVPTRSVLVRFVISLHLEPPARPSFPTRRRRRGYCTLALTEALPVMVNVHVFALLPPLEQAPDQITSRVLEALSVIEVPVVNVAEPVLPTVTLIPAGLEVTRSPVRPVAVTVSVAD